MRVKLNSVLMSTGFQKLIANIKLLYCNSKFRYHHLGFATVVVVGHTIVIVDDFLIEDDVEPPPEEKKKKGS